MSKPKIKIMIICFFDSKGMVHKEFVPRGTVMNFTYFSENFMQFLSEFHIIFKRS